MIVGLRSVMLLIDEYADTDTSQRGLLYRPSTTVLCRPISSLGNITEQLETMLLLCLALCTSAFRNVSFDIYRNFLNFTLLQIKITTFCYEAGETLVS